MYYSTKPMPGITRMRRGLGLRRNRRGKKTRRMDTLTVIQLDQDVVCQVNINSSVEILSAVLEKRKETEEPVFVMLCHQGICRTLCRLSSTETTEFINLPFNSGDLLDVYLEGDGLVTVNIVSDSVDPCHVRRLNSGVSWIDRAEGQGDVQMGPIHHAGPGLRGAGI